MSVPIETGAGETPSAKESFGFRFMAPLCLGSMLNPVNSTMISTALVAIARDFRATVAETGLLIGGLYITSAIAQPTMGLLADRLGARRVFLAGLYLIALAGVTGTFAPSLRALIWVRVLLGVGTSAAYPTAMRMLRSRAAQTGSVEPRMALGILSMCALSTVAIGAALGGILTGLGGWRMVFTVNLPLALVGILLVFLWIPEDEAKPAGLRKLAREIDVLGIVVFAGLLLTGMFFLMSLDHPNWPMLVVSVLLGFVLARHSLRTKQPFLNIRMLGSNIPLSVTYLRYGATNLMNYCMLYGFSQWLQTGPGLSSTKAGLITLPMSALAALSALAGGRMKGIRNPLIFGTLGLCSPPAALLWLRAIPLHGSSYFWFCRSAFPKEFALTRIRRRFMCRRLTRRWEPPPDCCALLSTLAPLSLPVRWACCLGNTRPITECTHWPGSWSP
jgi:MFS family permease